MTVGDWQCVVCKTVNSGSHDRCSYCSRARTGRSLNVTAKPRTSGSQKANIAIGVGIIIALIGGWTYVDHVDGEHIVDVPGWDVVLLKLDCGSISHPEESPTVQRGVSFATDSVNISAVDRAQFDDDCVTARNQKRNLAAGLFVVGIAIALIGYAYRRKSLPAPRV
jgi:hypothetical protein